MSRCRAGGWLVAMLVPFVLMVLEGCSRPAGSPLAPAPSQPAPGRQFVPWSTNPYFPLLPGAVYEYESSNPDEVERNTIRVTSDTQVIDGVKTIVVEDIVYINGVPLEHSLDYYAMDDSSNVWFFGEDTRETDPATGKVSTEGSWRAGVKGARPGIKMLRDPQRGDVYEEEGAPGVAESHAKVLSLDAATPDVVPAKWKADVLQTENRTPLEPRSLENKYYAPDVGLILEVDMRNGRTNHLARFTPGRMDSTAIRAGVVLNRP